jgi:hypothetical protein
VSTNVLADRTAKAQEATDTVIDEGDKGRASDELDAAGNIYATNYEYNVILQRSLQREWKRQ